MFIFLFIANSGLWHLEHSESISVFRVSVCFATASSTAMYSSESWFACLLFFQKFVWVRWHVLHSIASINPSTPCAKTAKKTAKNTNFMIIPKSFSQL